MYVPGILFKVSFKRIIAFAGGKAEVYRDISQRAPSPSFFSVLFCDEIPLDTIKSLPESPLKLHNYRNTKKTTVLIEHRSALGGLHGVAWELLRGAPPQTEVRGSAELRSAAH